jgi:membrane dipeptidase
MKRLLIALGMFILLITSTVLVLPTLIESRFNRTLNGPSYKPSNAAIVIHEKMTIVDLHADSLLWGRNLLRHSNRGHVDVPRLVDGNVAVQVFTVVTKVPKGLNLSQNRSDSDDVTRLAIAEAWPPSTWFSLKNRALYQANRLNEMSEDSHGHFVLIRASDDLRKILELRRTQNSVIAGVLGLEGAHALEGDVKNLDALFDAGFRVVGLTHFFDNEMAGSSTGLRKSGLTPKGRELIQRMETKHMLIDLAHASGATIDDVTAIASKPVVVSHTGVRGTCDNSRNLSDDEIRAVAKTGGLVGIGYWNTAICGTDAHAIAKAIRYVANLAGTEHVGIGSDFDGSTTMPFDTTGLIQITDALLHEGFSEREIRLIMGGNSLRLLRESLP